MNRKAISDRTRTVYVLLFFALALFIVGAVLRTRIGMFVQSYTENQTGKQAETLALLVSEKLNVELVSLEDIACTLGSSLDDMDGLMPQICDEDGVKQGLLKIDGEALYGESLDVMVYDGIQSSFRGNKAITYAEGEGLLFTCPVFNGPNIRYVLYRLYLIDTLEGRFATEIYDDLGKFCVTTRDGRVIIPFHDNSSEDEAWYESEAIQKMYGSMHHEMEVSVAVARDFSTDRGNMLLFESEIPGTDYLISGYVPRSIAAEGIGSLSLLIVWVFGLLMVLVMIGAFYLTRASIKIRESDELRHEKELAEAASRAKSDFLANMSHEIRTPINAVLGMNEMILRESSDEVITTYASNVKSAGNSLLAIINDILDLSKIEAGKIELIPVEYSMPTMINELVNMIQTRAEDNGLMLILDLDPGLPRGLYGDEVRIKQIIVNLLTNAVKYTEKGSVTFGIHYEEAEDDKDNIMLKVYVKDTGIGIRQEEVEKLFAEFERIDEKRNRNIEGTGLGMSITKNLLEMMGSTLTVESDYGHGSTFSFAIKQKVTDREPIGDYRESFREQFAARKRFHEKFTAPDARVLVVDDNNMNLMVFKSLIKQTGVKVDTADSGGRGIELTCRTKYDMVFLDHMMPDKDGVETLREIRDNKDNPSRNAPAVCLTANAISGAREEYLEAGFDDYLSKPIDPDLLEEMMIRYLPKELVRMSPSYDEVTDVKDGGEAAYIRDGGDVKDVSDGVWVDDRLKKLEELAGGTIDTNIGVKNNGNEQTYLEMLEVFCGSTGATAKDLEQYYRSGDTKNYAIKVHALKSSVRLIGATDLGEEAQKLEDAGKAGDIEYIRANSERFMSAYGKLSELISEVFPYRESDSDKPEADAGLIKSLFEEIGAAAEEMDCTGIDDALAKLDEYSIPESDKELLDKVRAASEQYDYETVQALIRGR